MVLRGKQMSENYSRPLDALNENRGKNVVIDLKNGARFTGKLRAFDIHINLVLDEAEESRNGEVIRKCGTVFLRGDTIVVICPA